MKKSRTVLVTILFFVAAFVLTLKTTDYLWKEADIDTHIPVLHNYKYHFVMIARVTEEDYWRQVLLGGKEVAKRERAELEYFGMRFLDLKELERFLEMAVLSQVDGILISVPNDETFKDLLDEAISKNVPVVALYRDIDGANKHSFVGIDTYELGYKTGEALSQAASASGAGEVPVAALINSDFSKESYRRYLLGFNEAIRGNPNLRLSRVVKSKGGSISAEEQTQSILKNHPEIRAIVCTDVSDTIGVAKVVVDLNRVSRITIIGSGLTAEIVKYIKLKVIWGVLTADPYELGAQGMSALIRLKQGRSRQENYYTPLVLVNTENVDRVYNNFNLKGRAQE